MQSLNWSKFITQIDLLNLCFNYQQRSSKSNQQSDLITKNLIFSIRMVIVFSIQSYVIKSQIDFKTSRYFYCRTVLLTNLLKVAVSLLYSINYWMFPSYKRLFIFLYNKIIMPEKQSLGSGGKIEIKKNNKQKKNLQKEKESQPVQEANKQQKDKKQSKTIDQKKDKKDKEDKKDKKDKKQKENQSKLKGKEGSVQKIEEPVSKKGEGKKQKEGKKDKKDKKDKDKQLKKKNQDKRGKPTLQKQRSDKQMDTIKNIHKSENKAKLSIQELIQQYKDAAQKLLFNNHGHQPEKQKQIQQNILKLQKQKENRHKKMEELQKHKEQIEQSRKKQKELKLQLKKQKSKEKKIQSIKNKLQNIQQNANERKKEYAKFIDYVKQRKDFVPRFKRYQQQYEEQKESQQQKLSQTLQEIDRLYRPLDKKELEKFEENYLSQKIESEKYRISKIRLENEMINQENKKLQQKLWRGRCHQIVQHQLEDSEVRKNADKEKENNRKEYGRLISQNFSKVETEENKEANKQKVEQQSEDLNLPNVHIRQKYLQGVSFGLVSEVKKIPLTHQQKDELGKQYLEYLREMNSHRKNKTIDNASLRKSRDSYNETDLRGKSKTFKIKRRTNPYYPSSDTGRKSLDLKNYESIDYALQKIKAVQVERELKDKILRHGQHPDILSIQEKKLRVGSIAVKEINEKLELLSKL